MLTLEINFHHVAPRKRIFQGEFFIPDKLVARYLAATRDIWPAIKIVAVFLFLPC